MKGLIVLSIKSVEFLTKFLSIDNRMAGLSTGENFTKYFKKIVACDVHFSIEHSYSIGHTRSNLFHFNSITESLIVFVLRNVKLFLN